MDPGAVWGLRRQPDRTKAGQAWPGLVCSCLPPLGCAAGVQPTGSRKRQIREAEPARAETEPAPVQAGRPRLGEVPVSREAAVARARELLPIPAELGEPEVNLWQSGEDPR